eukprot:m.61658 g.61658  ORF g.61658 m.61658 type:complete len:57 (+) comp11433_c0_seq5:969-1139(+)
MGLRGSSSLRQFYETITENLPHVSIVTMNGSHFMLQEHLDEGAQVNTQFIMLQSSC